MKGVAALIIGFFGRNGVDTLLVDKNRVAVLDKFFTGCPHNLDHAKDRIKFLDSYVGVM